MILVLLPIILSALIICAPVLILFAFIIFFYILWKILKCPIKRSIKFLLTIDELKELNSTMEKKLLELRLELKMSKISYEKISMNLRESKEENTDLKESILFYEKIVGKRR